MSVRRKLFLAMAFLILAMGVFFTLVTQFVIKASLEHMDLADRRKEIEQLSNRFIDYYQKNDDSWEGVQQLRIGSEAENLHRDVQFLLLSPDQKLLYESEDTDYTIVKRLGIPDEVKIDGETIATLYYLDSEVANISKLQIGISSSVTFLLLTSAIVFVAVSLLVAYWLSKRLTAPLQEIVPVIDRLGQGELGVQAPVRTKDEYGTIANGFNHMSKQLQRAEEVRRNLVADVAHELRTPLTIIRGKLDLLQQSGRSVNPESLLPLQDELIRLTRLVDDLHQLSLAEANRLPLERKPTDLLILLRRILDRIASDAEEAGVKIALVSRVDAAVVFVDPNRMTQVFLNLLVNALRYTPAGGSVTVTVEEEPEENQGNDFLRVVIADTGIGIAPDQLPFLFDRFYRTDEARTRNSGGTGLGLAIAKELVVAHNGTIEVESQPGQGTTFIIRLPDGKKASSSGTSSSV
ncbi:sensor histidine kinase [Desmospora activa]|uniref:histidine kinase n=1 Tax=Desmospora activa DSM 45169 TaxID=1121389 RepID=A0A2T4Z744_9BACL|nr:ATP-binding protein [Desmospora activa]PTM57690.1 two-component system sensor histidine kinase BaeS [Desmospora activa DSM 45169]